MGTSCISLHLARHATQHDAPRSMCPFGKIKLPPSHTRGSQVKGGPDREAEVAMSDLGVKGHE